MEKESLFDRMYNASKEVLDMLRKPLVERQLRRQFEKEYDDQTDIKIKLESQIAEMESDIKNYDMKKFLQIESQIRDCEYTMQRIAEHYKKMFGDEFRP